jgi:ElaA protein
MLSESPTQPHVATFSELEIGTLYEILKLRSEVFVAEQSCPYVDPDGRDTEPGTRHLWLESGGRIQAYLRILDDGDAQRIGRVVTAPSARGAGLAGRLLIEALAVIGDRPSTLEAQAHLGNFYARFGYTQTGPQYEEDGIPHIPMRRPAPGLTEAPRPAR